MATSLLTSLGLPSAVGKQVEAENSSESQLASEEKDLKKTKLPKRDTGSFDKDLAQFLKTNGGTIKQNVVKLGAGVAFKVTSPKAGTTVFTKLNSKVDTKSLPDLKEGTDTPKAQTKLFPNSNLLSMGTKKPPKNM